MPNNNKKKLKNKGLTDEELDELKDLFDSFEPNSQGKIDLKELKNSFESLKIDKNDPTMKDMIKEIL